MSGNNQHFIPQFLQRGFASHKLGKTAYTWAFQKNQDPLNERIRDIGAQDAFYTQADDTTVDDVITQAENHFGNLVNRLRTYPAGPVFEEEIPGFVAHLEVRTRHIRKSFSENASYLVLRLLDFISDTDRFVAVIQRRLANDPLWLRSRIIAEVRKQPQPPRDLSSHVNRLMKVARASMPAILEAQRPSIAMTAILLKAQLPLLLERSAKDGHLRALRNSIQPEARSRMFTELKFRVVDVAPSDFVLGDSAAVFCVSGVRPYRPYTEKGDSISAVFLPLGPHRVLIGEHEIAEWDYSMIKRQAARCSLEYFIAHENTAANRALESEIGLDASLLTESELEGIAVESFRQFEAPE